jgi:hypothetical protein
MKKQILFLKTLFVTKTEVLKLVKLLGKIPQIVEWSLDEYDMVLRVVCYGLTEELIEEVLRRAGLKAEKLNIGGF